MSRTSSPTEEVHELQGRLLTSSDRSQECDELECEADTSKSRSTCEKNLSTARFGHIELFKPWIHEIDPEHQRSNTLRTKWADRKVAMAYHLGLAVLILVFNSSFFLWASLKISDDGHFATVYRGDCEVAQKLDTYLHLLINILSSLLLGSSNFCQQLLLAPTREEVNRAHAASQWLDIGVLSGRNFKNTTRLKRIVWVSLGLSSGFLHLFWNSAIFKSLSTTTYNVVVVTSDYSPTGTPWHTSDPKINALQAESSNWERIDAQTCLQRYLNPSLNAEDVIVITNITSSSSLTIDSGLLTKSLRPDNSSDWTQSNIWVCSALEGIERCNTVATAPLANEWLLNLDYFTLTAPSRPGSPYTPGRLARVESCLSRGMAEQDRCGLIVSKTITILVCVLNLIKVVSIIALIAWVNQDEKKNESTLVTLGDAIASFLNDKDETTAGLCLLSRERVESCGTRKKMPSSARIGMTLVWRMSHSVLGTKQYSIEKLRSRHIRWIVPSIQRYLAGASRSRWALMLLACMGALLTTIAFTIPALYSDQRGKVPISPGALWSAGLGVASYQRIVNTGYFSNKSYSRLASHFFVCVAVANIIQVTISILYVLYNSLLTSISVAAEWSHYVKTRKPLRVSSPKGFQRSSYFLSLPLKFGLPVMALTSLLHWFISQAVFIIRTNAFFSDGSRDLENDSTSIGYSGLGMILSNVVGIVMIIKVIVLGRLKYPVGLDYMPLASTCSLAISAACHPPSQDQDASLLPVQWGVTDWNEEAGHCSFTTARDLKRPISGNIYR